MRKKEFEMLIRTIKSKNINEELKLRELSDAYCRYLKSPYNEDAMKTIRRFVLDKYSDEKPPVALHKVFLQASKYYIENGMYDEANSTLDIISDSTNINVMMQAQIEKDLIRVKQAAEHGKIDQEALNEIQNIVDNDEEHKIETAIQGRFTEYDVLTSYFADLPVEMIDSEIFPPNMTKPGGQSRPNQNLGGPKNTKYIEELSAERRLDFLREHFPIERIRIGRDKFIGTIIFEIKNSDLVIAENFFRVDKDGKCVEDYGEATYIIPKETELDLVEFSKGEFREKVGKERMERVWHTSEKYYEYLVERFNKLQSAEYKRIELDSAETVDIMQDDTARINDDIQPDTSDNIKNSESQKESLNDKKERIRIANENFLNELNGNLENIINPKMIEGMLTRASYLFEPLYNQKLKNEILDRLEILEVPKEQREKEAQKVFIYMRMTKRLSMINSGAIKGKELETVLDASTLEYDNAIKFMEKHNDDKLSYLEMVKAIEEFTTTGIDPFENDKTGNECHEGKLDNEIDDEPHEQPFKTLISEDVKEPKRTKAIDMATRFAEIMEKFNQITIKLERANTIKKEKIEEYKQAIQVTQKARIQEEKARQETKQAVEQEDIAKKAMQEAQDSEEQIKREQEELQEKISKIEELLR